MLCDATGPQDVLLASTSRLIRSRDEDCGIIFPMTHISQSVVFAFRSTASPTRCNVVVRVFRSILLCCPDEDGGEERKRRDHILEGLSIWFHRQDKDTYSNIKLDSSPKHQHGRVTILRDAFDLRVSHD